MVRETVVCFTMLNLLYINRTFNIMKSFLSYEMTVLIWQNSIQKIWMGCMCIRTTRTLIAFLRRAKENEEKLDISTKWLLRYIALIVLEAYKTLATAVPVLLTLPISVSPYQHLFSEIKLIRLYLWSTVSQDKNCKSYRSLNWEWSSIFQQF